MGIVIPRSIEMTAAILVLLVKSRRGMALLQRDHSGRRRIYCRRRQHQWIWIRKSQKWKVKVRYGLAWSGTVGIWVAFFLLLFDATILFNVLWFFFFYFIRPGILIPSIIYILEMVIVTCLSCYIHLFFICDFPMRGLKYI